MARTRSEYRLAQRTDPPTAQHRIFVRLLDAADRSVLPPLLLAAYRGTIDDDGEDLDDAVEAIDRIIDRAIPSLAFVAEVGEQVAGFSFVIELDGIHYIDPVVVAPESKRTGVGAAAVRRCLDALAEVGVTEVGATITDGNVASETLFRRLGFVRHGPWS